MNAFNQLTSDVFGGLEPGEQLCLTLASEQQTYLRFNQGRVRQATTLDQHRLKGVFLTQGRRMTFTTDLTGHPDQDRPLLNALITEMRADAAHLPEDPHAVSLSNYGTGHKIYAGTLPEPSDLAASLERLTSHLDFAGLYAGGDQIRITANSEGTFKAFEARSFFIDYSLYTRSADGADKSVKAVYAGHHFDAARLADSIEQSAQRLARLKAPALRVTPGRYRAYLEPPAVEALLEMLSWGALSYGALRRGESAFEPLFREACHLSPQFSLSEDFGLGLHPDFDEEGQSAPVLLPLIEGGRLKQLLINSRSAKEYGVKSNAASRSEALRSPHMAPGQLDEQKALEALGTGLYLSNLHYLNWSDRATGRITGMTRHACFWVEEGQIVAPIRDLRFDDTLYHILGDGLESVTSSALLLANTSTYEARALGGACVPGILVDGLQFTL